MTTEARDPGFDIDDHSIDELRDLLQDDALARVAMPQLLEKIERQNATIRNLFGDVLRCVVRQAS